ncbi:unnamed protein product [Arctogadus glacialis]
MGWSLTSDCKQTMKHLLMLVQPVSLAHAKCVQSDTRDRHPTLIKSHKHTAKHIQSGL